MAPEWGKVNLVAVKEGSAVKIETRPLPQMPPELAQFFEKK